MKKNQFAIIVMIIIIMTALCCACGNDIPIIQDKNKPFIVEIITTVNSEFALYQAPTHRGRLIDRKYSAIVLPTGWFNVGDTIRF